MDWGLCRSRLTKIIEPVRALHDTSEAARLGNALNMRRNELIGFPVLSQEKGETHAAINL